MHSKTLSYTFIVNPISGGKSKQALLDLIPQVLPHGTSFEVLRTTGPGHATELARSSESDIVVAVGGDGTVSEVAQGLVGSGKALGILPCGSGDGLALHLGLSRRPRKALEVLARAQSVPMDYGTVDGKPFFCTAGVGLDAIVAHKFAHAPKRGLGTYITKAWETWKTYRGEEMEIEVDGEVLHTRAVIVTVANAGQWGNQARIAPAASVKDGALDVTVVLPFRTVEIPLLATLLMTGQAARSRRVKCLRGKEVRIRRAGPGPAHYDGDPCLLGEEIAFGIETGRLRVVVPEGRETRI